MLSIIIDKEERISLFFCYYCLRKQCRSQRCSQLKITKNNIKILKIIKTYKIT